MDNYLNKFDVLKKKYSSPTYDEKKDFKEGYYSLIRNKDPIGRSKDFDDFTEDEIDHISPQMRGGYTAIASQLLSNGNIKGAEMYEKLGLASRPSVKRRILKLVEESYKKRNPLNQKELKGIRALLGRNPTPESGIEEKLLKSSFGLFVLGGLFFSRK